MINTYKIFRAEPRTAKTGPINPSSRLMLTMLEMRPGDALSPLGKPNAVAGAVFRINKKSDYRFVVRSKPVLTVYCVEKKATS